MITWRDPILGMIRIYKLTLSPWFQVLGYQCRFQPTCADYCADCFREHGPFRALFLSLRRVLRCHPFGGSGIDPCPKSTKSDIRAVKRKPHG